MSAVGHHHVAQAKAFLCWERFPGLAIQLVQVEGPVSYFFAPRADRPAIVVFVPAQGDCRDALFLLFHEVGHYLQYLELVAAGREAEYWRLVDLPSGQERQHFEMEAWQRGEKVLGEFVQSCLPDRVDLLAMYAECGREKAASYAHVPAEGRP
ncbi:MAG: hypothetical protein ONB30_01585 [candidate division KSB1 bacterium]|nr:hypothetical protein [candidate division KSB1 bacterium]